MSQSLSGSISPSPALKKLSQEDPSIPDLESASGLAQTSAAVTAPKSNHTSISTQTPEQSGGDVTQVPQKEQSPLRKKPTGRSRREMTPAKTSEAAEKSSSGPRSTSKRSASNLTSPTFSINNRPSRDRKAPKRLGAEEIESVPQSTPVKRGAGKVFDPKFITTNSASRLVKTDVYHMLLEASAWTSLKPEQRCTLISMLPPNAMNKTLLDRIQAGDIVDVRPQAFTMSNECFRTDVAKFKEDLKNGHLAKTWQATAEHAIAERAAGTFDAWKANEAELWWGQKGKQNGD